MKTPTRRELESLPRQALHTARNTTKADVYKLEWPPDSGQFAVLKDMRARPAWFRLGAGRWFLWREFRALRALDGIEGVPRALARPDADCILMEWRAGTPVMKWKNGTIPLQALDQIGAIIAQSHARGVVHGDLHRSNVLLSPEGQVTLIDWATAGVFGLKRGGSKDFTFAEWAILDRRSVAKLKARHRPESVSQAEKEVLLNGSKLYRIVRSAGFYGRKLLGQKRAISPEAAAARHEKYIARAQTASIQTDSPARDENSPENSPESGGKTP